MKITCSILMVATIATMEMRIEPMMVIEVLEEEISSYELSPSFAGLLSRYMHPSMALPEAQNTLSGTTTSPSVPMPVLTHEVRAPAQVALPI
jgi:hypothetical protein